MAEPDPDIHEVAVDGRRVFSAEGVGRLSIDQMAPDGQIWGSRDLTCIHITCQPVDEEGTLVTSTEAETLFLRGMPVVRVELPATMRLSITTAPGELWVQSLDGDVTVERATGDVRLVDLGGVARLRHVQGTVRAHHVADLRLTGHCDGDVRFESGGTLAAEHISGDLRIAGAELARIGYVQGQLGAERVSEGLTVVRADGAIWLNEILGPVALECCADDLRATALEGGIKAPRIGGDVVLHGPFGSGRSHVLAANGAVDVHLSDDPDLKLTVRGSGRIRSDVQLAPAPDGSATFTGILGRGTGRLVIEAKEELHIRLGSTEGPGANLVPGFSDFGERIRQQVSAPPATTALEEENEAIDSSAGVNSYHRGHRGNRDPGTERSSALQQIRQIAGWATTGSEQVAVLGMLASGVITAEEAEGLLLALGG